MTLRRRHQIAEQAIKQAIADLALYDRPLDGIASIGAFEVADQSGGRGSELDDTPLEQLDTRGALGHG